MEMRRRFFALALECLEQRVVWLDPDVEMYSAAGRRGVLGDVEGAVESRESFFWCYLMLLVFLGMGE